MEGTVIFKTRNSLHTAAVQSSVETFNNIITLIQFELIYIFRVFNLGRWMDNIKIDLLEIGLNVVDWIGLAQDRYRWRALVNSVMNLRVP
jgi:hypothetical protein